MRQRPSRMTRHPRIPHPRHHLNQPTHRIRPDRHQRTRRRTLHPHIPILHQRQNQSRHRKRIHNPRQRSTASPPCHRDRMLPQSPHQNPRRRLSNLPKRRRQTFLNTISWISQSRHQPPQNLIIPLIKRQQRNLLRHYFKQRICLSWVNRTSRKLRHDRNTQHDNTLD